MFQVTPGLAASLLVLGCSLGGKLPVTPTHKTTASSPPAHALDAALVVPQLGTPATLIGKIRLISEAGGALISEAGGAIISNNSGGLISEAGGALIGKIRFGVLATAPAEAALADAVVRLTDAGGRVLVDDHQQPLMATSDATGSYKLSAVLRRTAPRHSR